MRYHYSLGTWATIPDVGHDNRDSINGVLPNDLLTECFSSLRPAQLRTCGVVSRRWLIGSAAALSAYRSLAVDAHGASGCCQRETMPAAASRQSRRVILDFPINLRGGATARRKAAKNKVPPRRQRRRRSVGRAAGGGGGDGRAARPWQAAFADNARPRRRAPRPLGEADLAAAAPPNPPPSQRGAALPQKRQGRATTNVPFGPRRVIVIASQADWRPTTPPPAPSSARGHAAAPAAHGNALDGGGENDGGGRAGKMRSVFRAAAHGRAGKQKKTRKTASIVRPSSIASREAFEGKCFLLWGSNDLTAAMETELVSTYCDMVDTRRRRRQQVRAGSSENAPPVASRPVGNNKTTAHVDKARLKIGSTVGRDTTRGSSLRGKNKGGRRHHRRGNVTRSSNTLNGGRPGGGGGGGSGGGSSSRDDGFLLREVLLATNTFHQRPAW